jgi:hypothetical protein
LAFNSNGNLFASAYEGYVYEFAPSGSRSIFATVPNEGPTGIAFAPGPKPGDFNGDNKIDINDLTIVLSNYNTTYGSAGIKAVPEPSCLVLLSVGAIGWVACVRRRKRALSGGRHALGR